MSATPPTVRPVTRFWLALERLPGRAATAPHWRHLLRDEFDVAARLMRPDARLAGAVPRLDGSGLYFTVVEHGPDDFVGVGEDDGDRAVLSRADLVVYRVDPARLVAAVAAGFGVPPDGTPVADLADTFRVGPYRPRAGLTVPVFLTLPLEHRDYQAVVHGLLAVTPGPFVLSAPTNRHHRIASQLLFDARPCLFLPLADAVRLDATGCEATAAARAELAAFAANVSRAEPPGPDEPLAERARDVLVAMLELDARDSDRRQPTARIAERAFGGAGDANSLKPVITDLARNRLVDTRGGRGGGCWLTERGVRRAEKLGRPPGENG